MLLLFCCGIKRSVSLDKPQEQFSMELVDILNKIGLQEKEAKVYLALLELGTADVSDIAVKAGIKRPTCYVILDELKNKALVSEVPSKVNLFTAESPEKFSTEMYKKQELFKRFLPNMMALYNAKKEKPQVQMFEGRAGITEVYKKIYNSDSVSFFGTVKEALKYDFEDLNDFVERVAKLNFKVRDLLTTSAEDLAYAQKAGIGKNYEIRFLPDGFGFLTDNAFFGETVVFFSFHPQIFAVTITSREISQAIKTLFEFAWQAAEPYEKIIKQKTVPPTAERF